MKQRSGFGILSLICLLMLTSCTADHSRIRSHQQGEALRNLAEAYMADGNFTFALRELLEAEQMIPDDPFLHNDLGLVYLAKKRYDLSIESFRKAVSLNPDYIPARNNLGTAYLAKGDWDAAIEIFQELSENLLYGTPHYPLSNLGWAYYNKKDYRKAQSYYLQALRIEPKFIIALRGLAKTYAATGETKQAIDTLEKAIAISPRFSELYYDMGETYELAGDRRQAVSAYRKVISISPGTDISTMAADRLKLLGNPSNSN